MIDNLSNSSQKHKIISLWPPEFRRDVVANVYILGEPVSATNSPSVSLRLTADIIAAFVSNNSLPKADLPRLIETVHAALTQTAGGVAVGRPENPTLTPAVPVRKSVTADYIVCLEDGKQFKSLRRHLNTLGTTPAAYRAKWGLPPDYPMVAPNYAARRSEIALKIGLGQVHKSVGKRARTRAQKENS